MNLICRVKRTLFISRKRILSYIVKNLKKITTKNSLFCRKTHKLRDSGIKKETLVGLLLINLDKSRHEILSRVSPF